MKNKLNTKDFTILDSILKHVNFDRGQITISKNGLKEYLSSLHLTLFERNRTLLQLLVRLKEEHPEIEIKRLLHLLGLSKPTYYRNLKRIDSSGNYQRKIRNDSKVDNIAIQAEVIATVQLHKKRIGADKTAKYICKNLQNTALQISTVTT